MLVPTLCHPKRKLRRLGATLALTASFMVVLLGFTALAVDTMVLAVAKHQATTSAEAASLAAAHVLANEARISPSVNMSALMAAAHTTAEIYAKENEVLGADPVIVNNFENEPAGDIVIGYLDVSDPDAQLQTGSYLESQFNSAQVRVARTADRGGLIPTTFARVLGIEGSDTWSQSTATALNYTIEGFEAGPGNSSLMPIVLDQETYDAMISHSINTTDQYTYNPSNGAVTSGSDGIEESKLYPVRTGNPGNWGTVNIGVNNNSTKTLGDQIRFGVTEAQLNNYPGGKLELDTSLDPPSVTLGGDPGISAGIKDDLKAIIGQPRTIPIYDVSGGNGNNAWFRIVKFAPVRVLDVSFKGNPKYVIVQPALVSDDTAISGELQQTFEAGGLIRLHLTR